MAEFKILTNRGKSDVVVILWGREMSVFDTKRYRGEFLTAFIHRFCKIRQVIIREGIVLILDADENKIKELIMLTSNYPSAQKMYGELAYAIINETYDEEKKKYLKKIMFSKLSEK